MNRFVNVKEQFFELLNKNVISDGRIITNPNNLPDSPTKVEISFSDINVDESNITFYDDPENDRAELTGAYYIDFNQVDRVIYSEDLLSFDGLYGAYDAVLHFKDESQVLISFNMKNNKVPMLWETTTKKRPTIFDELVVSFTETKKQYLDAILNHKGAFMVNIDTDKEEEDNPCIELNNGFFNKASTLRGNELLSFSNVKTDSIFDNMAVYIELANIVAVMEFNEDNRDQFEISCDRVLQFEMVNSSRIIIGLFE